MNTFRFTATLCAAALVGACGGGSDGTNGTNGLNGVAGVNGLNAVAGVNSEVDASICSSGGSKIQTGLDANANGILDVSEVIDTSYVCNGATGASGITGATGAAGAAGAAGLTSLVAVTPELPGMNCPSGGNKIQAGIDTNADQVLGSSEVTSTQFTCNGTVPVTADFIPPQISTTAPLVAIAFQTNFTTTLSDNVGLAYIRLFKTGEGKVSPVPEGLKNYQAEDSVEIFLGETITRMLLAVDTSGNVTKKTVSIVAPETELKRGTYYPIQTYSLPTGFDCLAPNHISVDGGIVNSVYLSDSSAKTIADPIDDKIYEGWSVANGYIPSLGLLFTSGTGVYHSYRTHSLALIPLTATSTTFEGRAAYGGGWDLYESRFAGVATLLPGTPPKLRVTLNMKCNINNAGFIDGTTANFDVQMAP